MSPVQLKNETYEPKKLEAIYQNLLANFRNDRPQDYEIKADDFTIVARNKDPERFLSYSEYINPETKYISILLYRNNSNTSDKYFFHLKSNQYSNYSSMEGLGNVSPLEIEQRQKDKWRKDLHYEQLVEENAELQKQVDEYENIITRLKGEKDDIKSNRDLTLEGMMGMAFTGLANSEYVKKNFPVVNDLAGVVNPQNPPPDQSSFKRKKSEPQDTEVEEAQAEVLRDIDREYVEFLKEIKGRISKVELDNVMHVLDLLVENPHAIPYALKQIINYLKNKPNPDNEKV